MPKIEADVDVIAVTGMCVEERRSYARRLAAVRGFVLVPAEHTAEGVEVVDRTVDLLRRASQVHGIVLEYPFETPVMEIVGSLNAAGADTRLIDLVCVLDVGHMLVDIGSPDYVGLPAMGGEGEGGAARESDRVLFNDRDRQFRGAGVRGTRAGCRAAQPSGSEC